MEELEVSGKTVEEAIQEALDRLGVSRHQVDVAVLSEGKAGVLGMGAEDAMIKVSLLPTVAEESRFGEVAEEVLGTLLAMMRVDASITREDTVPVILNITGDDPGVLIGRRGQTLAALQYIVRLIVSHKVRELLPVVIDVEGYKARRNQALQALAHRMAERVKTRGMSFALEPMSAYERRIIHLALTDHPDVITESTGEGESRKVVIIPRGQ